MTDVYDRSLEPEFQSHLCPKCGHEGLTKSRGPNREIGLYEEVYVCPRDNCHTKWVSMFALIEKVVMD